MPLFRYYKVYKTYSTLWKNIYRRRTQTHNDLICDHPKGSAVGVAAQSHIHQKNQFLRVNEQDNAS